MPRWHLGIVVAAAFGVYANCLGHGFLWDDQYLIIDNPQIREWRRIPGLFASDLFPPVMPSGYYRPLQALTNLIDYQVWGLLPAGFHLTNMALHAATALALYLVAIALLARATAALVAALLFAVHPVHTEAIAYVSGRSDPLSALLLLAALLSFIRYRRAGNVRWLAASVAAFAVAMLAREASLALLFLLPLVDAGERRTTRSWTRTAAVIVPYVVVALGYAVVRRAVIDAPALVGPPGDTALAWRVLTMLGVVGQYLALLLVPMNLHMERQVLPATSLLYAPGIAGLIGLVALVALALRARERAWPVTLGVAWFLLALIPVANIWPLATFMAEHWLYVPSMGLFLAVGWAVDRVMTIGYRREALIATAAAGAILGLLTIVRNRDWRGPVALYEATTRSAPHSARAWTNLAHAYGEVGRAEDSRRAYERALQAMAASPPSSARSARQQAQEQALVGSIEQQRGRFAAAEARYRAALALDPTLASAFNNLGLTVAALGRPQEAEEAFVSAIRLYPDFAAAHSNRGNVRFRRGELEAAREDYQTAIRLNPEYAEAYNNLGSVHFRLGDPAAAADAYRRALELKPDLEETKRNLAVVERAATAPGGGH